MKTKWIILGCLVLLALLACPQSILYEPDDVDPAGTDTFDDSEIETAPSDSGKVTIKVPLISSYLAEAMGIAYTEPVPASRAILIVSKVDFDLYDSGDTLIDSWTYDSPAGEEGPDGGGDGTLTTRTVPSAAGYTLQADVYNAAVSTVTPILSGTSAPFEVTSGTATDVTIRPIPLSPTAVDAADTPVALPDASFTSTYWDGVTTHLVSVDWGPDNIPDTADDTYEDMPVYTWGKEHWFAIDNSTTPLDIMRITASPDASSAVVMMIVDSTGSSMTMSMSGNSNPQESSWTVGEDATLAILSPDSTYYVGMMTISDGTFSVNSAVGVSFTASSDDAHEENETVLTATAIAKGTIISGVDLDPIEHEWPNTGGDLYKFTLTAAEDPANIDIYLVFDHDQGNLCLILYDDAGNELANANDSIADGTAAEEQETILDPVGLTVGSTYYILVGSNNSWPVGNTYQLQWVSGEGTINIGLQ